MISGVACLPSVLKLAVDNFCTGLKLSHKARLVIEKLRVMKLAKAAEIIESSAWLLP